MPSAIIYHSPLGDLYITSDGKNITSISFNEKQITVQPDKVTEECCRQLDEYFAGIRKKFDISTFQDGTQFQQTVWSGLTDIEYGRTTSYQNFSRRLGNVKAIRAVGNANGRNNIAIVIPCHRVIGSNGNLVGYAGKLWRKKWLLEHEARMANGVQTLF